MPMKVCASINTRLRRLRPAARIIVAVVLMMAGGALNDAARAEGCGSYPADYKSPQNANAPALRVTFHNKSAQAKNLYWVDFQGTRQPFGTIAPGRARQIDTFGGHVWVVTNRAGKCVDFIVASNPSYDVAKPIQCIGGEVVKCVCGVDYTGTPPSCVPVSEATPPVGGTNTASTVDPNDCGTSGSSCAPAYAGWYRQDGWSGEYPNGVTIAEQKRIMIRGRPDPANFPDISCELPKGATYHTWNKARVASDHLKFISFTRIESYRLAEDFRAQLERSSDHQQTVIVFKRADQWDYLAPQSEGTFLMRFAGVTYYADQELFDKSTKLGQADQPIIQDEWMRLNCTNGAVGWILIREIKDLPGFSTANITAYGVARDKG
jgi:hypothetical protein